MKKEQVKVGSTYRVKVSGAIADVRLTGENPRGGWDGVNVATNRKVRIKTAQRLRGLTPKRPSRRKKIVSLAEYEAGAEGDSSRKADIAKTVDAVDKGDLAKGVTVPTGAKRTRKATGKAKAATKAHAGQRRGTSGKKTGKAKTKGKEKGKKAKVLSGLDAAAKVLAEAGEPLGAREMVQRMLDQGLWQTSGKTPAATIYAAIIREIAARGDASRFEKSGRGLFQIRKGA